MKIAFFGGSFDPPHLGHLAVANAALASGRCDEIIFAPAWAPPHKIGKKRAEFADRFNMVKLLVGGRKDMIASDIERRFNHNPAYTIEVLEFWQRENPSQPITTLLIGGDSLAQLHTWRRAEELVEKFEILTYPREFCSIDLDSLLKNWSKATVEKLISGILSEELFRASSTDLRNQLEQGAVLDGAVSGILSPEVAQYIQSRGLYRRNEK